jgi:hypothetical protein
MSIFRELEQLGGRIGADMSTERLGRRRTPLLLDSTRYPVQNQRDRACGSDVDGLSCAGVWLAPRRAACLSPRWITLPARATPLISPW